MMLHNFEGTKLLFLFTIIIVTLFIVINVMLENIPDSLIAALEDLKTIFMPTFILFGSLLGFKFFIDLDIPLQKLILLYQAA